MTPRLSALLPATVVALALVLTGCVPEGAPSPSGTAAPSATPSNGAAPLLVPSCADLLSRADIDRLVGPDAEAADVSDDQYLFDGYLPTVESNDILLAAESTTGCWWGEPQTDTGVTAVIAELTVTASADLRSSLESEPLFTEEQVEGADVFSGEDPEGLGHVYSFVLLDDVWIAVQGMGLDQARDVGLQLLASLRAVNPALPAAPDAPVEEPEPLPSPSASAAPTPSPSPTAGAPGAVLPACDELLPLDTVRALFADEAESMKASGSPADHMPGPLAANTVRKALQAKMCTWAIPFSDGGFSVVTAEIGAEARKTLLDSLRSSSTYREKAIAGEPAFSHVEETELGTTTVVYVFVEAVWITVDGTLDTKTGRQLAREAVDAVRIANS